MKLLKGDFLELQNFSVNDGDGIRTTVFFAGCPLMCEWCANPEGFTSAPKIAYYEDLCVKCGACVPVCPQNIGIDLNSMEARGACNACGECVKACETGARRPLVHSYTVEEVLKIIERQAIFYRYSKGGVTFSGGEATRQVSVLKALVDVLYDQGISLSIETSGYFQFEKVAPILQKMDLIFVDIKHMDAQIHFDYTGVSNQMILDNIVKMNTLKIPVVIRIPVINGVNADVENIRQTAIFVKKTLDLPQIELLPYHAFGNEKYRALGMKTPSEHFSSPDADQITALEEVIRAEGVHIVSYK
ncbi:glycyl-radical enzyme activating protein [Fusibacter ferrireducens]|uniref:Glycyl-radical enzyme activating protein n=1 Tax=Fusibacter ferrireducens TaxID=2785058 RepID=A0ABR9ZU82_9FIRM|nr:glycyl-radical enzyme activating protein [Fusibacter ferrireducens]MBF4694007.1 glycyl-radical enzyme activating protein [Fusibacter ferrireducens]